MAAKSAPAIVTGFQEDTKGNEIDDLDMTNDPSDAVPGFPGMAGDSIEARLTTLPVSSRLLPDNFTYSWKNLSVDAPVKKRRWRCWKERPFRVDIKQLPILRSLCGTAKAGELWALMGSSGAGKTTLLNSLNFRNQRLVQVTGDRCINGVPIGPDNITAVSGYLQQDDLLPNCLTCREHLTFIATLRLPSTMSCKQRGARVDEVLRDVGLWHVRNVYIGGGFSKGISGGEKKRLAFASEILTDPSILFCDEPTSGLDSYMATIIVDIMKKMASRGKLVISTIHQPSTDVFKSFDYLYLLTEGRLAYAGPREGALKFFAKVGYECPPTYNPADFFIRTMAIVPDYADECRLKVAEISLAFAHSDQYKGIKAEIQKLEGEAGENESAIKGAKRSRSYEASYLVQYLAILGRLFRMKLRDPQAAFMRVFSKMCLAVYLGVAVYDISSDMTITAVGSITGILIMSMLIDMMFPLYITITSIPVEMPLTMREHWNGLYSLVVFYLSRSTLETIFYTMLSLVFFPIIYWMGNFAGPIWRLGYHLITLISISYAGNAAGALVAYFSGNIQIAIVNAGLVLGPFLLFAGFLTDEDELQPPINLMKYLSMDFYAAENMMSVQWEGVHDKEMNDSGLSVMLKNGSDVLLLYKYGSNYWRNIGLLAVITGVFRFLGLIVIILRGMR